MTDFVTQDYFQFYEGSLMGIKDVKGRVIVPAAYDFVSAGADGVFQVKKGKLFGYVDAKHRPLFPLTAEYETLTDFSEGLARFRRNELYGYLDKTGRVAIPEKFVFAEDFSNGRAAVRDGGDRHGAIDRSGKLVVPCRFEFLGPYHADRVFVSGHFTPNGMIFGLVDENGAEIVPEEYHSIELHGGRKAKVVRDKDGEAAEGELDLDTRQIAWNHNLDKLNEGRRIYRQLEAALAKVVESYWARGCPCRYPRFAHYAQFGRGIRFYAGELLFRLAEPRFKAAQEPDPQRAADVLECPACSARYSREFIEYNAFFSVTAISQIKPSAGAHLGAPVVEPIPIVLGFQLLTTQQEPDAALFAETSVEEVSRYLLEEK